MGVPFWNNCLSISGLLSTQEMFQTAFARNWFQVSDATAPTRPGRRTGMRTERYTIMASSAVGPRGSQDSHQEPRADSRCHDKPRQTPGLFCPKEQTDGPPRTRQLCGFSEFVTVRDYAGLCAKITKHQPGKPAIIAAIKNSREHSTEVEETSKKKAECKCRKISGK